MKTIIKEQFEKLIDCEFLQSDYKTWKPAKFYNRGREYVNIAILTKNEEVIICSFSCGKVRVNGIELTYIPSYGFTNPKNPFKNI